MTREIINVEIKTKNDCPMKETVLGLIDAVTPGDFVKIKTYIGEKDEGMYTLYLDSINPDNLYGRLAKAERGGTGISDEEIERLIADGNYEFKLVKRDKNRITGTMDILKPDTASASQMDINVPDELRKVIEEKVAEGIVEEEDLLDRIRIMKQNKVDDFLMLRIVNGYRKYKKPVHRPACIYVDPFLEASIKSGEEPIISEILRSAVDHYGMVFEGEKSVGKNVAANTAAWLLGMPERLFTCSRQMTTSTLYGEKTTDNSAVERLRTEEALDCAEERVLADNDPHSRADITKAAKFEVMKAQAAATNIVMEDSELCDWLEDGGVLILNEMNLCEPNLLASFLNPILDGTGYLTIQGRGEVKINQDCVLIGTQNADYAGCEDQNEATMSRLGFELFKQPDSVSGLLVNAVKAELDRNGFGHLEVDPRMVEQADGFYRQCRTAVGKGLVSNAVLSIRGFARALAEVTENDGNPYCRLRGKIRHHVVNGCPASERDVLDEILNQKVSL